MLKNQASLTAQHEKLERVTEIAGYEKQQENECESILQANLTLDEAEKKLSEQEVRQLSELEAEEYYQLISEKLKEAQNSIDYISKLAEEIKNNTELFEACRQSDPQEKLKQAIDLNSNVLSESEKKQFIEIEKALSSTFIIKVSSSKLIDYQVALLGEVKKRSLISKPLFDHLFSIRKNYIKDNYKFIDTGFVYLKADADEIVQALQESLQGDHAYQTCLNNFIKRLKGIEIEIFGIKELKIIDSQRETFVSDQLISDDFFISLPSVPLEELGNFELNRVPNKNTSNLSTISFNRKISYDFIEFKEKADDVIDLIKLGMTKGLKKENILDETTPVIFGELMQASLVQNQSLSCEERYREQAAYIAKVHAATNQAWEALTLAMKEKKLLDEKVALHLCKRLKESTDDYKDKKEVFCTLSGEILARAYFGKLKDRNLFRLENNLDVFGFYHYNGSKYQDQVNKLKKEEILLKFDKKEIISKFSSQFKSSDLNQKEQLKNDLINFNIFFEKYDSLEKIRNKYSFLNDDDTHAFFSAICKIKNLEEEVATKEEEVLTRLHKMISNSTDKHKNKEKGEEVLLKFKKDKAVIYFLEKVCAEYDPMQIYIYKDGLGLPKMISTQSNEIHDADSSAQIPMVSPIACGTQTVAVEVHASSNFSSDGRLESQQCFFSSESNKRSSEKMRSKPERNSYNEIICTDSIMEKPMNCL